METTNKTKRIHVILPLETHKLLKLRAAQRETNISNVVREAVDNFVYGDTPEPRRGS